MAVPHRTIRQFLVILLVVFLGTVMVLFRSQPEITLDPRAKIDLATEYRLVLWDEEMPLSVRLAGEQKRAIRQAINEFNRIYPNVSIAVRLVDHGSMQEELREAVNNGTPPDVAMVRGGREPYLLQLPITKYLEELGEHGYFPPTLIRSCIDENIWTWPSWSRVRVMAFNRNLVGKALTNIVQDRQGAFDEVGRGYWVVSLNQLQQAMSTLKGKMIWQGGNAEMFTLLMIGEGASIVQQDLTSGWTAERILTVAKSIEDMVAKNHLSFTTGDLLDNFYSGNAAIIAPVGPWIIGKASEQAHGSVKIKPSDIGLLPLPASASFGPAPPQDFGVAVFRQEKWKGAAHTRLAMEFGRLYAKYMGLFYASVCYGVPAYVPFHGLWAERLHLDDHGQAALLAAASGSSVVILSGKWEMVREQLYAEVIEPVVITFQQGKTPATELAQYLAERIEGVLTAQKQKNKSDQVQEGK